MIAVITAIAYLGRVTDSFFEAQMQRAAIRIRTRLHCLDQQ